MLCILGLGVDHDDGTFFGTMECQWFFTCQPLVSMVFPMVFSLGTMVFQWFFIVGPLVSMVFPMVFPLETMFFQWFFTVGPLVSMVFPMVFPFETMVSQWFFTVGQLVSMVFQWFPMVANHWSDDIMVSIYRSGLGWPLFYLISS